jgi:hypothetical protein
MQIKIDVSPAQIELAQHDLKNNDEMYSRNLLQNVIDGVYARLDDVDNENEQFRQLINDGSQLSDTIQGPAE